MAVRTTYASKDATARESGDAWNGWDSHLPVGQSPAGLRYRSFIYFPLSFTGMTSISDAKLWLRASRNTGGTAGLDYHVVGDASGNTRQLEVRRVLDDWGEGTNRGEGVWGDETWGWNNRATDISVINIALQTFTGYVHGDWYSVDVTGMVNNWFTGSPNYGLALLIHDADTVASKALEFFSRHLGSGFKPYIEITYSTGSAPNAPTGLSPTSDALVNTLSPTLTGTGSDPDAGDYITAYQILLYEDDGTTLVWDSGGITQSGTVNTFSKVYSGPSLGGNRYYKWMARTRDVDGSWGPYSALQRFKTNTPPNPPSLSITESPNNDLLTLTPTLNVTHSDNDTGDSAMYGYRIVVEFDGGTPVWDSGDVDTSGSPITTLSTTYSGPSLAWGIGYRWRARTKDSNGVWGAYSANQFFNTHDAARPINLSPAGENIGSLVPIFSGQRGSSLDSIDSYGIQVYQNDELTLVWDSGNLTSGISSGAAFIKSYTGTALSYGTTYKWRAYVHNTLGDFSPWSAFVAFDTATDATVPYINTPTPNDATKGTVTSLTPTLSGGRSTAFTHYQIEVYPASATSSALGSPIWDSTDTTQSSATTFSRVYSGPALDWNTIYKLRVRVGAPTLGSWSGLSAFLTDSAGVPTLTAPANGSWDNSNFPTFQFNSFGGESIAKGRIRVWNAAGTVMIADSGDVTQTPATSFSWTYSAPESLVDGLDYQWEARYTKTDGVYGPYSTRWMFHLNARPSIPTQMFPTPGYAFSDTLLPVFRAYFEDADKVTRGDYPTQWTIEVRNNATNALIQTKTITTGLNTGLNTYTWQVTDTTLAYNTVYKWRTYFHDSFSDGGTPSSYQTFLLGQPPVIGIISPSEGSNVNTTRPTVTWSYSDPNSSAQLKFRVKLYRVINNTLVYDSGERVSGIASFSMPTGFLSYNDEEYRFEVTVWNSLNLPSNTDTSTFQLELNAPPPIEGLSGTVYEHESRIFLEWDASSLGANFVTYVIYRRRPSDTDWTMIGLRKPETNTSFSDWYAGQGQTYEYRVTVVKKITNEPDLESPDSDIVTASLVSDVWMVIGADRSVGHIFELPVASESHSRPVQQESFEPLGSNRKAVVRGFVLGHEGSVDVAFDQTDAAIGKQRIEYLLYYAGPHILKNPFGDVFDVTFGSPDYAYQGGGSLNATLTWIEVGATNNPGVSPDEFLAQIGAE